MSRNKQRNKKQTNTGRSSQKIWGIVCILFGAYSLYAFTAAMPAILDKIIGKIIFSYLFGNGSILVSLWIVAIGIALLISKIKEFSKGLLLSALFILNMMVLFSSNIPNLTQYTGIKDLLDLALYGHYGGIIGNVLAYYTIILVGKNGLIALFILTTIIYIGLFIRTYFTGFYEKLKANRYGLNWLQLLFQRGREKVSYYQMLRERKQEKKALQESLDNLEDTSNGLFKRDEEGSVSVDTQVISIPEELLAQLDEDAIDEALQEQTRHKPKEPFLVEQNKKETALKTSKSQEDLEDLGLSSAKNAPVEIAYRFPSVDLLDPISKGNKAKREEIENKAQIIETTLHNFDVSARITGIDVGPTITRFELKPDVGVKVNRIVSLADDLALKLATTGIRIEAPIPGKAAVGIEVPNDTKETVGIRELITSPQFQNNPNPLAFALGKSISGQLIIGDLADMPHVLIAGATGSGKSVCINSIIISLLYKSSPEDVKFILIDPKMVELNQYNGIPHLMIPVVTDPQKASYALSWALKEMTDRYQLFKENNVRNIDGYNELSKTEDITKLPRIVIIIDELSDLMMTSPKECEHAICRLAQLARACGIHLVIATQRPSVDVITGLIKANIPSRIAFAVTSNTDSRTILDMAGAEKLLGKGDMLYFPSGISKPIRSQCTFVNDKEIKRVLNDIKKHQDAEYDEEVEEAIETKSEIGNQQEHQDELLEEAIDLALNSENISTSMLQRRLRIGYARAGRIIDTMESMGLISGPNGSKPRNILISYEEYKRRQQD